MSPSPDVCLPTSMKLSCYALKPDPLTIRPAPLTRPWMDRITDNHAYRCLPLNIANSHGWEVLSPCAFTATWSGGIHARDLKLARARRLSAARRFCRHAFRLRHRHLPPVVPVSHRAGLGSVRNRTAERRQGRHRAADRRDRNRLAALSVHDELAADAAGHRALREGRAGMHALSGAARRTADVRAGNPRISTTIRSSRRRRLPGRSAATSS